MPGRAGAASPETTRPGSEGVSRSMELGVYSFGDIHPDPVTGARISPQQQLANTLERIRLADELGLHYFGLGEHHRPEYAISAPATVLAAAAGKIGSTRLNSSHANISYAVFCLEKEQNMFA